MYFFPSATWISWFSVTAPDTGRITRRSDRPAVSAVAVTTRPR
jgi:hypothetical protein